MVGLFADGSQYREDSDRKWLVGAEYNAQAIKDRGCSLLGLYTNDPAY